MSAGEFREGFSSLRKAGLCGKFSPLQAELQPACKHEGSEPKPQSPNWGWKRRKTGGTCALAGMIEPSFLGISCYVKIMRLGWFGIVSYLQQRHLANSASFKCQFRVPCTSLRSLYISRHGLVMIDYLLSVPQLTASSVREGTFCGSQLYP